MMPGPGGQNSAAVHNEGLRASHADREQVIGTLKAAFVQGMLAKDEFDERVGQALAARTYGDLGALTADLGALPVTAQAPAPARAVVERPVARPGNVMAVATALYAGVWCFVLLPHWPVNAEGDLPAPLITLLFSATLCFLSVSVAATGYAIAERLKKQGGGGQSPPSQLPAARLR